MKKMKIRKAIIPVAGFGTRFLPATKAQPKGMLPIVDKPVIQFLVEEAIASGIEQIIFVTSQTHRAIEDHFDRNFELEYRLAQKGKKKELNEVKRFSKAVKFAYVRQMTPRGDGDAIDQARELIGDEPCAVLFGDDVVDSEVPCLKQLMNVYEKYQDPVIAVYKVPKKDISKYGCVGGVKIDDKTMEVTKFVEKPKPSAAPSDLAIIGKYIITPEVLATLAKSKSHTKDGEIRLIDAFIELQKKRSLYAYKFEGKRYDCGNKLEFLTAAVDYGLKHPEINANGEFMKILKDRCKPQTKRAKKTTPKKKASKR